MGDYEDIKVGKESQFNEGIAKLIRIGELKRDAYRSMSSGQFETFFNAIKGIRDELHDEMDKDDVIMCDAYEIIYRKKKRVQNSKGQWVTMHRTEVLDEYFRFLCTIQKKIGMGMPSKRDRRFAMH